MNRTDGYSKKKMVDSIFHHAQLRDTFSISYKININYIFKITPIFFQVFPLISNSEPVHN